MLAAQSAPAQEPAPITLPTVVVTATAESPSLTVPSIEAARLELAETPGGTAVVDAEEYKRGRATTLGGAINFDSHT
jgi:iron complex outermembrane recepter protein